MAQRVRVRLNCTLPNDDVKLPKFALPRTESLTADFKLFHLELNVANIRIALVDVWRRKRR